jgi:hypothetical protein
VAQHLDLGRRKALRVRIGTALHLEARSIVDATTKRRQKDLIERIVSNGDALWDEPPFALDKSLRALADGLPQLRPANGDPALTDLHERKDALGAMLRQSDCASCAGKNICRGDAVHDDLVVTQHGKCLDIVKDLLFLLQKWCTEIYAEFSEISPTIELSTASTHDLANHGLLERFGISGWHQVGRSSFPTSTIGLTIQDRSFNWESLCSLYYTFLHELFCHAFQAMHATRREDADRYCPWSEGWMDRLAFEIAREWLVSRVRELPEWLQNHTSDVDRISGSIHDYRYKSGAALPDPHGDRRRAASEAFAILWHAWGRQGAVADHRITLFSIRLNLLDIPPDARMQFGINLPLVLAAPGSERFELACGKCSEFAVGEVPGHEFLAQIRELVPAALISQNS